MPGELAERGLPRRVKPAFYASEVSVSGRVWKIVGYGPDAKQQREQMRLHIGERELHGRRWRRDTTMQHGGIEIKERLNQGWAIVQHANLNQSGLKFYPCAGQQPW